MARMCQALSGEHRMAPEVSQERQDACISREDESDGRSENGYASNRAVSWTDAKRPFQSAIMIIEARCGADASTARPIRQMRRSRTNGREPCSYGYGHAAFDEIQPPSLQPFSPE